MPIYTTLLENQLYFIANKDFPITAHSFIFTGYQRTSANNDFHDSTQSGKVGPVWSGDNKPLLKVQLICGIQSNHTTFLCLLLDLSNHSWPWLSWTAAYFDIDKIERKRWVIWWVRSCNVMWDHVMLDVYTAECCVSLRNLIGDTPESVVRPLTHSALAVGEIEWVVDVPCVCGWCAWNCSFFKAFNACHRGWL